MKPKPPEVCPKCGDHTFNGPRFQPQSIHYNTPELLKWECSTCRYEMFTPTLEAQHLANVTAAEGDH